MSTPRHLHLLDAPSSALVVVDVQERFRTVVTGFDAMAVNCARLVSAFRLLDLPVLVTEQYPKGLGRTVPEVLAALGNTEIDEKTAFSSAGCAAVTAKLAASKAGSVLVCGIETHVCVNQTVHDLLADGYTVHVAVDAVASRRSVDRDVALQKMQRSGAVLTTSEMAAFELLADAKHPRFKDVQALFK